MSTGMTAAVGAICSIQAYVAFILAAIMRTIFVSIAFYVLYIFIMKETKIKKTMNVKEKCFEIIFLVSTILELCFSLLVISNICFIQIRNHKQIFVILMVLFWGIQSFLLLLIFYNRLLSVFQSTRLRLQNKTKLFYKILFIAIPIYYVMVAAFVYVFDAVSKSPFISAMLSMSFFLLFMTLAISLMVLFQFKLVEAYKSSNCDPELIAAITKLALLSITSLTITFLQAIMASVAMKYPGESMGIISNYVTVLDVFTNFCCIVLCYGSFKHFYIKICSFCDAKCSLCVNKCINNNNQIDGQKEVEKSAGDHELIISTTTTVSTNDRTVTTETETETETN